MFYHSYYVTFAAVGPKKFAIILG